MHPLELTLIVKGLAKSKGKEKKNPLHHQETERERRGEVKTGKWMGISSTAISVWSKLVW